MKHFFTATFILLFSFCCEVNATHIVGGEMTYVCQGEDPQNSANQIYTFTMNVYRDCFGGQVGFDSAPGTDQFASITVFRGSTDFEYVTSKFLAPPQEDFVNPLNSPCIVSPPNVCVEQGVYVFDLSLPISDESYFIVYQRCCRNGTISNISLPEIAGSTFFIELTKKAQEVCNSSPVFTNTPSAFACINRDINYDNGAIDAEGDQLVYEFCSPLLGGSTSDPAPHFDDPPPYSPVQFLLPNYSASNPMAGDPQITIDPNTGLISGVPNIQGQFVVGICVKEFRDGELLSTVQRDFQFNVTVCELVVNPGFDAPISNGNYVFNSCENLTVPIINDSGDENFINEYSWEFEIPGADPLVFETRDINPTFPDYGTYFGKMILNPDGECSDSARVQVTIQAPILADFEFEYDTCVVEPIQFTDLSIPGGATLKKWTWSFGDGSNSQDQNPVHQYDTAGVKPVVLIVRDSIGCRDTIEYAVGWFPAPAIILVEPDAGFACNPATISFDNLSSPIDDTYDFLWDFGDGNTSTDRNPSHLYESPGNYDISIEITSPFGCFEKETWNELIEIGVTPLADFFYAPSEICILDPLVEFNDASLDADRWFWQFDENAFADIQNPSYTFVDTGFQEVKLVVQNENSCQDTLSKFVDVVPKVTYHLPNAFTPNNDGLNDFYQGKGILEGMRSFNLTIWNRWGELVFETSDPSTGWNGQKDNSGLSLPQGVYICRINYTGPRGQEFELKSFATLIR